MQNFTQMIDGASLENGILSIEIPPNWMQGRTIYGGLSAAIGLECAHRNFPGLPPLRSATVAFIGPAGGAVTARARILRQGKSVTFVEADVEGERGIATRCTFAFGAARPSIFDTAFTEQPSVPTPEACEPFIPEGAGPSFSAHFDTLLAKGGRPVSGSSEYDNFLWVRHRDENPLTDVSMVALADMPPPAILPLLKEVAPVSSMTWIVNFLTDDYSTEDGWWLLESRAEQASHGYSSQDMLIWDRNGRLVVAGKQSVTVFA